MIQESYLKEHYDLGKYFYSHEGAEYVEGIDVFLFFPLQFFEQTFFWKLNLKVATD